MKVALFVHGFFPEHYYGTETYTLEIARNLRALGHEPVVVAAVAQEEPRRAAAVTRYAYEDIPVIVLDKNYTPHAWIRETYWHEAMREPIRGVLDELRPDIVHVTHIISHTAVLLDEVRRAGVPLVGTLTDFFGFCANNRLEAAYGGLCAGPSPSRGNCIECHVKSVMDQGRARALTNLPAGRTLGALALRAAARAGGPRRLIAGQAVPDLKARPGVLLQAYRNYDLMIAPTRFLRDAYVRNGFEAQKLRLSPFGVDLPRTPKPPRPPGAPLSVGFIGQIGAHKGPHLLVEAMRDIPAEQAVLKLYGPDPGTDYGEALKAAAGPGTSFEGAFAPERMAQVLAGLDVLAIPSTWYENSPLVLLNALASHTPVIVSDVPGMTEFVREGQDGWIFRRGDGADLARVLAALVADPDRARAMSATTAYVRTTRAMTEDVVGFYGEAMRD